MKFIQIKDGISINKECIELIERLDNGGTRITTHYSSIESIFPYETILNLLEKDAMEEKIQNRITTPITQQFWRG